MTRLKSKSKSLSVLLNEYDNIRDTSVSWRRKSSYRKPIKRSINKLIRRQLKNELSTEY